MATYTIRTAETQNWRDSMMSKAEFNAVAAERRANRAGSGFDEFGKHLTTNPYVNEGLWCFTTLANKLGIGYSGTPGSTLSKTYFPISNINGVNLNITGIFDGYTDRNIITLPPAPTVLPHTATLTQQQIDSGVITHADASNSGLIVNGKFDTDTSGWTATNATLSVVGGVLRVTGTSTNGWAQQNISTVVGKKYIIEVNATSGTAGTYVQAASTTPAQLAASSIVGYGTLEFIATTTTTYIRVYAYSTTGTYADYDNIAIFPADAISRSDLVFLESWHEDVSEKDFVYPLGNVQYLGATGDCGTTAAGTFAGSATYSLFSDTWQADSALVGKGYVWSTMTDANKKAFVANPENNCYLDGDKVIQVRYRMRVVQGWGDSWAYVDTNSSLVYNSNINNVALKGKSVSVISDFVSDSSARFISYNNPVAVSQGTIGAFAPYNSSNSAYEGKCFALPIALVHRRNQGAYHPVYNANGSSYPKSTLAVGGAKWYEAGASSMSSISDCFTWRGYTENLVGVYGSTGYISSTYPGRTDGLYYDQVHEGDILDLRMSSQKVEDYNRLIDREFNKVVAGTTRGSEGEWSIVENTNVNSINNLQFTNVFTYFRSSSAQSINSANSSVLFYDQSYSYKVKGNSGVWYNCAIIQNASTYLHVYVHPSYGNVSSDFTTSQNYAILISKTSTRTKSNTLTHCDIIGSPANYPTAWKQSGVSGVPLIVAEDGTSMLPTGALTTFKLSRKANATPLQVLKSTDSGATWTILTVTTHYTFNTITNAITFVTAPATTDLIMVTYQTHTSMAVPAVNSEVLAIGDVVSINAYESQHGVNIASNMIMKVPVWYGVNRGVKFTWYETIANAFWANSARYPIHSALSFNQFGSSNPAVKTFPYLTRSNGKAYLNLVFKEMKYNGTSWGDNNKFNIVDNVSTTTDDNGATVLIGQKRVELPYFIGQGE